MTLLDLIPNDDRIAVLFEDQQLTYRELHLRSAQIAARLGEIGIAPEAPIGLMLERSLDLMPAILGIWKAGGAYVPIDPRFPLERREGMIADAGIRVVVDRGLLRDLPCEEVAPVHISPGNSPGNLAYILYTSGSTGRPNGVAVEHRSVVNFIEAVRSEMAVTASDTILAVGPLSFDISVMELYLPLAAGARLAISSPGEDVDRAVRRFNPTMMIATPATWQLLLTSGWRGGPHFKAVSAGDVLTRGLANDLLSRVDKLWNGYGPTETTAGATFARVLPGDGPVPIGRPIANVQVSISDENELLILGAGLARGYWNRPELTASRFIETPLGRAYRTGDRVRQLPDGQLEFVGRLDDQVKVRGIRVEPSEIEAVFRQHPAVRDAAVTAVADRLDAYLVSTATEPELRAYLQSRLPEHLWPSRLLFVDHLPLTPNGKLDRRALPAIGSAIGPAIGREAPKLYTAPRTQIEKFLAIIFAEVLQGEDRIGAGRLEGLPRSSGGPAASRRADTSGSLRLDPAARYAILQQAGGRDSVHDPACGVLRASFALYRRDRHLHWNSGRRPHAQGDRERHRAFHQYRSSAHEYPGREHFP